MMNIQDQLQEAKSLIQNKQFADARKILNSIDHPTATKWLAKLDEIAPEVVAPKKVKPKGDTNWVNIGLIAFLVVIVGVFSFVAGRLTSPERQAIENLNNMFASGHATSTVVALTRAASTDTPITPPTATQASLLGTGSEIKWEYQEDISSLDDSVSRFLVLDAENSVQGWLGRDTPSLVIRCENGDWDMYIFTNSQVGESLSSDISTRIRFGTGDVERMTMGKSSSGDGMFFPNTETNIARLLGVNQLVIEYTPFNASPGEAVFDISGLNEAIHPLFDSCGELN